VVDMQEVFAVATTSSVSLFVFGQTSPFSTISGLDNVKAIAADSAGNLYVSTCGTNCGAAAGAPPDSVNIYAPPYNGTPTVMSTASSIFRPQAIAFDGTGNMYVAVCNQVCGTPQQDAVLKFSPPFTATSTPSVDYNNGVVSPDALALDTSNDLFVADNGATGPVQEYASGAISGAAPTNTVTSGVTFPNAITLDAANNLYVSNGTGSTCGAGNTQTVSYYAAGSYTVMNGSFPTTHVNCPISLAFDTVNNRLFIGNSNSGSVNAISEFKNPINSSGSFQLSIANSVNDPVAMLLDSSHNLYVANNVANSATIYNRSAGYGLQSTISGVTGPIGLAIVP